MKVKAREVLASSRAAELRKSSSRELRKTRRSEAELREEAYQDTISQDGENNLETGMRETQSTVNQRTHQMKELQRSDQLLECV